MTINQQQQLQALLQSSAYAGLTDAAAATLASTPTVTYTEYWLTARTIYDQTCALYNDNYVRGAAILSNFQAMATARPYTDFYSQITTPGSQGLNIGNAKAQAFLGSLVDPAGTYTPGPPPVTNIAAGKLLTPQEAQILGALGSTSSYPIPGVTSVVTADVTAARAAIAEQQAGASLAQSVNAGQGSALSQINQAVNAGTTLPTALQLVQAFAAGAFPSKVFTITGG